MSQSDVARASGTTQATVARWELGDTVPQGDSLHAAAFALGVGLEEALALACAQGVSSGTLPKNPFETLREMNLGLASRLPRGPLHEVASLGLEAELWSLAVRDKRWDTALAFVATDRSTRYLLDGRLREAEGTAKNGLRLPPTPLVRLILSNCFYVLLDIATYQGVDPRLLAEKACGWSSRLTKISDRPSDEKGIEEWMRWEAALRLADIGQPENGLALIECDLRPFEKDAEGVWTPATWASVQAGKVMEIELRAGRGDKAEAWLSAYEGAEQPDCARRRVRVLHAQGRAANENDLEAMRAECSGDNANWYVRRKIEEVEIEQARLSRI